MKNLLLGALLMTSISAFANTCVESISPGDTNILKSISLITCFSVMFSIFVIGQSSAATFYIDIIYGDNNNDGLSPSKV